MDSGNESFKIFRHLITRFLLLVKNPLYLPDLISSATNAHPSSSTIAIIIQFFSSLHPVLSIVSAKLGILIPAANPYYLLDTISLSMELWQDIVLLRH